MRLFPANLLTLRWPNSFKEVPGGKGRQPPNGAGDITWDRYSENALTHETCYITGQQHHANGDRQALPKRQSQFHGFPSPTKPLEQQNLPLARNKFVVLSLDEIYALGPNEDAGPRKSRHWGANSQTLPTRPIGL